MSVTTIQKKESDNMNETVAVVENQPPLHTVFLIEIKEHIFQRLSDLAAREQISLKWLAPQLLTHMLCCHRREVKEIVETIQKRAFR
jgi:hypothetical protein